MGKCNTFDNPWLRQHSCLAYVLALSLPEYKRSDNFLIIIMTSFATTQFTLCCGFKPLKCYCKAQRRKSFHSFQVKQKLLWHTTTQKNITYLCCIAWWMYTYTYVHVRHNVWRVVASPPIAHSTYFCFLCPMLYIFKIPQSTCIYLPTICTVFIILYNFTKVMVVYGAA